tara:strand:- start:38 stop:394 length:357 start_codon:yes stop_codon:yes gene_type:complete
MAKTDKFKKDEIATALEKAGTVSGAAQILGCNRRTVYTYMKKYPVLEDAIHDARERLLDIAESALMSNIKDKHPSSVFFFLKTMGKNRGYVERIENTGKNGEPIVPALYITDAKIKNE